MGKARPVTDEDRQRVRELHAEGKGRNEIAEILGRSGRTISTIAKDLELSFARAAEVRQATEIRQADLADRRAALAQRLQDVAERELEKVSKPHTYFDWGGKDHDFDTYEAPEPTPADKRALLGVVATAVDRSLKLAPPKEEGGADEVGSLLTGLFDKLRAKHGDH
ncbi:helix-turn-helix domain-containing protein [Streptomyces sp. 5-8]|uniref:Helix-turn-helix domain-containing protein n=1 Tax=Streptomyces musisoli TaxID=2802280 RepID=A0ABS1P7F1_9ACTN|nr:helix-turn-helix domain-containing protein [Streptomyces musisoli]MBL1107995.1 helix-turn-helix domain-containing protein [Streptomyces musisoli]